MTWTLGFLGENHQKNGPRPGFQNGGKMGIVRRR